ncbi:MAG: DUF1194 domain-containing protein [Pseudomonadota bacterium]|nr:DUF1194 domain-containing protein [Pseudomonadota bacterium]
MGKLRKWAISSLAAAFTTVAGASAGDVSTGDAFQYPSTIAPQTAADYYYNEGPLTPYSMAPVQVRLLLVLDASSSMSSSEYSVQINGVANALTSDTVKNSWFGVGEDRDTGPIESIAIGVVVFDSSGRMRIPWVDFRRDDPNLDERLELFAENVRFLAASRQTYNNGATHIGESLIISAQMFENAPWESYSRDVIDLSGDGENNGGRSMVRAKQTLAEMNVTINGLAIINEDQELDTWYEDNLITRADEQTSAFPGRVWVVARNELSAGENTAEAYQYFQDQFELALREKLVWEVAGIQLNERLPSQSFTDYGAFSTGGSVSVQPISFVFR